MADIEQKIIITTETNAEDTAKKVDVLSEAQDNTSQATNRATKVTQAQKDALGELAPATTGAVQGLLSMGKAMWALVANPLGAVLTAIAAVIGVLFLAFKNFVPLVDKVEQVFGALGAVVNVVKNAFISVVTGTKSLGEAFSTLGDDMDDAADRTMALVKAQQDLEDVMASQEIASAKNRAEINKLNVELRNRTKTDQERLAISEKIIAKENADFLQRKKLVDEEVRIAREAIAIKAQFTDAEIAQLKRTGDATKELAESRGGNYDEEYKALNSARLKAIALEDEATTNLEKTYNRRDKIEDDQKAKQEKAAADRKTRLDKEQAERVARMEAQLSSEKKLLQDVQDLQDKSEEQKLARQKSRDIAEIKALEKKGVDVRESLRLNTEKYNILEDELKAKRAQELKDADALRDQELKDADEKAKAERIEKEKEQGEADIARAEYLYEEKKKKKADDAAEDAAEVEQKRRNAEDILATGDALITGTKMLAGKNKALQRAAIITEGAVSLGKVGVNIATGVSKDASTGAVASVPQIIKTLATGAISTASIIANTSKALSAIGGGGGGSIGSGASPTGTSATPQVQFQNSSENQIANSVNQAQQNLQVTVLESDISKAQGNVKVLVNENSF